MHGTYGYFEEGKLGKPYDWPLWRRFFRYGRPYVWVIALSIFLVFVVTAAELTIPYLLKIGIDRYIVVSARRLHIPPQESELVEELLKQLQGRYQPAAQDLFITSRELRKIDPRLIRQLEKSKLLTADRFYFTRISSPEQQALVAARSQLFVVDRDLVYIDFKDLSKLSRRELRILRHRDLLGLYRLTLLFVSLLVIAALCTFGQNVFMVYAGQHMMHDLRMQLFTHIQGMSLTFFNQNPVGRLVTRLTNDIQNMDELFSTVVMTLMKDVVLLTGILLILFRLDWQLTLVTLSVLPLIILLFRIFGVQVRVAYREIRTKLARINSSLNEYISGIRVIKMFQQEKQVFTRFRSLNNDYYRATLRQITVQAVFFPCIELLATTTTALLLWYGGLQVISESLTLGALVAFLSYLRMFFGPIR
ncbi:MAG: ABC transporter ATP-binding protein, partial [Deltaproteobacteria bacterium]|nr:ABC transporter ATP-binding protein [Deltaproteobacteria bacterium]